MLGGVIYHMLPHLPKVPHLHVQALSRDTFGSLKIWLFPTVLSPRIQRRYKLALLRGKLGRSKSVMYRAEFKIQRYEALISGMTDFAHLNDFILLKIVKAAL